MKPWLRAVLKRLCVRPYEMDNETRKRLIAGHMTEIMQLLNLDLSDDSLMETPPHRENVRR
jgi:GTP cyclohydrolase I